MKCIWNGSTAGVAKRHEHVFTVRVTYYPFIFGLIRTLYSPMISNVAIVEMKRCLFPHFHDYCRIIFITQWSCVIGTTPCNSTVYDQNTRLVWGAWFLLAHMVRVNTAASLRFIEYLWGSADVYGHFQLDKQSNGKSLRHKNGTFKVNKWKNAAWSIVKLYGRLTLTIQWCIQWPHCFLMWKRVIRKCTSSREIISVPVYQRAFKDMSLNETRQCGLKHTCADYEGCLKLEQFTFTKHSVNLHHW